MKSTNKRLVSILLCLAMVLAVMPMAFAADTTTVYCDAPDSWTACYVHYWGGSSSSSWPGDAMTLGEDGIWSANVPSDSTGIIFNNGNGIQTSDMAFPTDENVQYNYEAGSWSTYGAEVEVPETVYYLRGSMNSWVADETNAMTNNGDGTYTITMDLAAGTYEYKAAVADWSWSCPSGGNLTLTLEADDTVTFTLDLNANSLTYTLASGTVVEIDYYLRGSMNEWTANDASKMTKQDDGTYAITLSLAAGDYEFKAATADWSFSVPGGDNATLSLTEAADVTFVLDVAAGTLTNDAPVVEEPEPEPMVIESICAVGAGSGNFLYGVEWDPASSLNVMDGVDNVYTITYMGVAAGTYEYKFAANGAWDISFGAGCETVSGEIYDAYLGGANNTLNVASDNSTVTLTLDLSGMDFVTGEGAVCSVEIIEPAVSSAPEAMVLGSNQFSIASGDTSAITSTYVVEEAGILAVNVSAMTTPDGEVPEAYIPMQFGRMYALLVNGEQVWLPCEIEVAVGDVVEIGVQSFMGSETSVTIDLSIREPGVNDVKWQLNADATADSATVDLRLISWVDSLDYQDVKFIVTIEGVTAELSITTVYEAINANGATFSTSDLFGQEGYVVTYTIEGLSADYYGSEISVTVCRTDLEGNAVETETRTIVVSDAL